MTELNRTQQIKKAVRILVKAMGPVSIPTMIAECREEVDPNVNKAEVEAQVTELKAQGIIKLYDIDDEFGRLYW